MVLRFCVDIDGLLVLMLAAHCTLCGVWFATVLWARRIRQMHAAVTRRQDTEADLLRRQIALQEAEQRARSNQHQH